MSYAKIALIRSLFEEKFFICFFKKFFINQKVYLRNSNLLRTYDVS